MPFRHAHGRSGAHHRIKQIVITVDYTRATASSYKGLIGLNLGWLQDMRLRLSLRLVVRTAKSRNSLFTNILHKLCWLNIYFHVSSFNFSCQNTTNKPHMMSKRIKFIFHERFHMLI